MINNDLYEYDVTKFRENAKRSAPTANLDGSYTFYYDETNNIRTFYVKEFDFNSDYSNNFLLGGLVHEGTAPDIQPLIANLKLQKTIKEVKFFHLAKGSFLDCLKSKKLLLFLKFIQNSELYIHYSSLNILYWSIVDIVDSAVVHSEVCMELGRDFSDLMKNALYKLAKKEINSIVVLFRKFEYPNIKECNVLPFIEALSHLLVEHRDDPELHLGLESLRQILKEAKRKDSLPFIMHEKDYMLIDDFLHFFMRPIYTFKNSSHIFDKENSIEEKLMKYKIINNSQEIKNYSFIDSKLSQLTQLSDIWIGIMGKLHGYINTNTRNKIKSDFHKLNSIQSENIDLILSLIDKSHNKNIGFLFTTDSYEEMSKMDTIRVCSRGLRKN